MFFFIRFILVWTIWLLFADKKRWRELLPVAIFAGYLGLITDVAMDENYKLWEFKKANEALAQVSDDTGIYIVVTYLFIQWLPQHKTVLKMFLYWFTWVTLAIGIEWIHVSTGHMIHHKWWNFGYSYLADWTLFWLFYQFHKIFGLKKLSKDDII
jgi:hypothetical protein